MKRILSILLSFVLVLSACNSIQQPNHSEQDQGEQADNTSQDQAMNQKGIFVSEGLYLVFNEAGFYGPVYVSGIEGHLETGDIVEFKADSFKESYPAQAHAEDFVSKNKKTKGSKLDLTEAANLNEYDRQKFPLIDVRTKAEFDGGHVPGARLIELDDKFEEKIKSLYDTDSLLIVYCRSGNRSALAQSILEELGYSVIDAGGIQDYRGQLDN